MAGFSVKQMAKPVQLSNGNAPDFVVRIGPNYDKHKKKAASAMHVYEPVSVDLFKAPKIQYHLAEQMNLQPLADADVTNDTGLPRRLIINTIIAAEAPKMFGGGNDGSCFQMVLTFQATTERLREWQASGSPACPLFRRFYDEATADPPNLEIKERWKLLAKINNIKQLGLGSYFEKYNGKPALITKSGSIFRGDDYLEVAMNTFRFSYITNQGVQKLMPKFAEMDFHFAVTVEGRSDDELPEQLLACANVKNLDFVASAVDPGDFTGFD